MPIVLLNVDCRYICIWRTNASGNENHKIHHNQMWSAYECQLPFQVFDPLILKAAAAELQIEWWNSSKNNIKCNFFSHYTFNFLNVIWSCWHKYMTPAAFQRWNAAWRRYRFITYYYFVLLFLWESLMMQFCHAASTQPPNQMNMEYGIYVERHWPFRNRTKKKVNGISNNNDKWQQQ